MQFPKIISVEAIEKYKLTVKFDDQTDVIYDVSDLSGKGVFKIWDTNDNFFKVFVNMDSGAISWPGEIDIDTIMLTVQLKGFLQKRIFRIKWIMPRISAFYGIIASQTRVSRVVFNQDNQTYKVCSKDFGR